MPMNPRLLRPTASGVFDPRRIAGLGLWLDAGVDSSLTFNASTVSEWRDLSGNGRHFSQSTAASQPSTSTLNGRRVLSVAGASFMVGSNDVQTVLRNVSGVTVICVASFGTGNNTNLIFFSNGTNQNQARFLMGRNSSYGGNFGVGGRRLDADSFAGIGYSAGTGSEVYAGLFDYSDNDAFLFAGGTQQASNTSFLTAGNTSDTSSLASALFGTGTGTALATATLGELLIYSRALSATERQAAERYLGRKWGLTVA
jgi:hypothetical protein